MTIFCVGYLLLLGSLTRSTNRPDSRDMTDYADGTGGYQNKIMPLEEVKVLASLEAPVRPQPLSCSSSCLMFDEDEGRKDIGTLAQTGSATL